VLQIPVRNSTHVDLIQHEPAINGFKLTVSRAAATGGVLQQQQQQQQQQVLYARKVVLATGIQVG
jgi:aspartate oxidase